MSKSRDLYEALGVKRGATHDELRAAYRKLARKHHPDVNPENSSADERFKEVAAAYDVLGDDEKRKTYDEFGMSGFAPGFDAERARAHQAWSEQAQRPGAPQAGAHASRDWGDLSDLMGDLFRGGRGFHVDPRNRAGTARQPRSGPDIEAALDLDFLDAIRGFATTLVLTDQDPTTGRSKRREIRVNVPPGAETGKRIRLRGQGHPGVHGGPSGDLYVVPTVRMHPRVVREGSDLVVDLPITVAEAMRGARVEVPVPTGGQIQVTVPKGTQSGQRLRVKGKGVAAHGSRSAGDLYLRAMIRVPSTADVTALAAAERLNSAYAGDVRKGLVFR